MALIKPSDIWVHHSCSECECHGGHIITHLWSQKRPATNDAIGSKPKTNQKPLIYMWILQKTNLKFHCLKIVHHFFTTKLASELLNHKHSVVCFSWTYSMPRYLDYVAMLYRMDGPSTWICGIALRFSFDTCVCHKHVAGLQRTRCNTIWTCSLELFHVPLWHQQAMFIVLLGLR